MKTKYEVRSIAVALIASLSLGASSVSNQPRQADVESTPVATAPPFECYSYLDACHASFRLSSNLNPAHDVRVRAYVNTLERTISLSFLYLEGSPIFGNRVSHKTTIATTMWPTSLAYLGNKKVAVAGKNNVTGLAEIQVWTLDQPTVIKIDGQNGAPDALYLRPSTIQKMVTVFSPLATSGFGQIRAMWSNHALGEDHVMVAGFESKDLFNVNLSTGTANLVASDTISVGGLSAIPDLATGWESYFGPHRHSVHGDLYALSNVADDMPVGDTIHSLYLWDHDMDGIIDEASLMSHNTAIGLGLESGWID